MYNSPRFKAITDAGVAELVDALDLGSSAARRESSSLFPRTTMAQSGSVIDQAHLTDDGLKEDRGIGATDSLA